MKKKGYNNKSLLNLKPGKNHTSFSRDRQPPKAGIPDTSSIRKLMANFGRTLAPQELRDDDVISHFLTTNGLKGTVHEVLIARLYAQALYNGDLKAMKLILDTLDKKAKKSNKGFVINFITPPAQEPTQDLDSDSWSITQPGESGQIP